MLTTLAVANYRSLRELIVPLGRLNLVVGANGSGKSNLYRALRLLAESAQAGIVPALAREGGLGSALWAGPETISRAMRRGEVPVQGGPRQESVRLCLGFASEEFGYAVDLGYPEPSSSAFAFDPQIKREAIWSGPFLRGANTLVDRNGNMARVRDGRSWCVVHQHLDPFESVFGQIADPQGAPEVLSLRETIRGWRFYDHFRSDADSPARLPQLATRTPVLSHDGRDVAAAWQTILEIGDARALDAAVADAFPGAEVKVSNTDGRFLLHFSPCAKSWLTLSKLKVCRLGHLLPNSATSCPLRGQSPRPARLPRSCAAEVSFPTPPATAAGKRCLLPRERRPPHRPR